MASVWLIKVYKMPLLPTILLLFFLASSVLPGSQKALLGFEPRISCLLDRRFNQLSHRARHEPDKPEFMLIGHKSSDGHAFARLPTFTSCMPR